MRKKTRDIRGFFHAPTDDLVFAACDTWVAWVPVCTAPRAFTLP